jgi:hypothetical protein
MIIAPSASDRGPGTRPGKIIALLSAEFPSYYCCCALRKIRDWGSVATQFGLETRVSVVVETQVCYCGKITVSGQKFRGGRTPGTFPYRHTPKDSPRGGDSNTRTNEEMSAVFVLMNRPLIAEMLLEAGAISI